MPKKKKEIVTAKEAYRAWVKESVIRHNLGEDAYKRGLEIYSLATKILNLARVENLNLESFIPEKEIRERVEAQAREMKKLLNAVGLDKDRAES